MRTYNEFKASSFTRIRQAWLGLLNIVMAMGSALGTAEDAVVRGERANRFYTRAVALAAKPSVRGPSLDIVQYLLLASQYLQGTPRSSQTWTLHGLAVKGAFAIGLHSNQASQRFTALENEIRKRTWFGCILLDRVLSMTFGRPPCKLLDNMCDRDVCYRADFDLKLSRKSLYARHQLSHGPICHPPSPWRTSNSRA